MLSAFTARPIVELKPRDKSKIESILAYGDRLLVGLSTGSLRIYRVNESFEDSAKSNGTTKPQDAIDISKPPNEASPKPVELLRELEKFSTRPIEQLARLKEASILISLSNGYISIHDIQTYELQEQLAKTKNASTFAVTSNIVKDSQTGIPEIISRLAVAVKRRLLLWSWHESEMSLENTEVTLSETIRTLTWASATKIICGMNSGYVIVDVLTRAVDDIVGPGAIGGTSGTQTGRFGGVGSASMGYMGLGGYVPKPLAAKLAEDELLLAKDINSLFINADGKPQEKRQIPWQAAPDAIGYSYPYILALQPASQGMLDVRNPETLSLLQSIPLANAKQMHFPPPSVSVSHTGKGFCVASERAIWRMGATDYDTQVDELVSKGRYDEALSILSMLEDALLKNKVGRVREIKIQKAQALFDERKYRQAIDIFMGNEGKAQNENVQAPPERVIRLYPRIIAGDLSTFEETISQPESEHEEESKDGNSEKAETPMTSPKLSALGKVFNRGHQKTSSDTSTVRTFMRLDGSAAEEPMDKPVEERALEGKDLLAAARELNQYLVQARNEMKTYLDAETGKMIRPAVGDKRFSLHESFKSLLVFPVPDEDDKLEARLIEAAKLIDTTLFRSYMLASPSLAGPLFRIANFCDPDVVGEKLEENGRYNDLVDFFHGKKLHRQALELLKKFGTAAKEDENAPTLHGPQRTIGYLQGLSPELIDLILEFSKWPLQADPKNAMEIFIGDTENAETLPREKVLAFLQDIDVDLAVRYLEHMVNELNDETPDFHNQLVTAYLQDLKKKDAQDTEEYKALMDRSLNFLRTSNKYALSSAFRQIPKDDPAFYEAQAIVLSNMEQHKQALEIYVFKIMDYNKAEEYCNFVYKKADTEDSSQPRRLSTVTDAESDQFPSIYHTLLSLYLNPSPPNKQNWPAALSLLSKHGSRLPASSTLDIIPPTLPVADLESYFRGRIRAANSIVNESRVATGLRKTEVVSTQAALLLGDDIPGGKGGRNRRVLVQEERVCGACHKRIGPSVVAVLPSNEVVHFGCLTRLNAGGGKVAGVDTLRGAMRRW